MDLKAYLKGAGIGIIVTAVILMIVGACNNNNKISDEEVIKRAKELGYVESSTLTSPSSLKLRNLLHKNRMFKNPISRNQ